MLNIILRKALATAAIAGGAAVATAGARYYGSKRINAAEKLGAALVDSAHLEEAAKYGAEESEAALAACAAYLINLAHQSASGITGPPAIDSVGFERKIVNDRNNATASIITTAHDPEARWQFDVDIPGTARVSGSRRLKSSRFAGTKVHMQTPDTVSIRFDNGYVANLESDLEFDGSLLPTSGGRTRVYGEAMLSDNRRNVGRMKIEHNGMISGTITRGSDVIGRFEGSLGEGITFRQYAEV